MVEKFAAGIADTSDKFAADVVDTGVIFTGHFCLGWWSNFVGSESGQKQSVKPLQNMVYSTIQHPPPPTAPHTVCLYWVGILSPDTGRGIDSRNWVWNWVAKLRRLAGRYDNPMPTWFLAPIGHSGT